MSTKIYAGCRFTHADLNLAYEQLDQLRPEIARLAHDAQLQFIAVVASRLIDDMLCGLTERPKAVLSQAIRLLLDRQREIKQTNRRDPIVDFECLVCLLPTKSHLLGMILTEQRDWRSWLLEQPFLREYAYWDSSDKPDECSEEEWEIRRYDWDCAFPDDTTPAERGLSVQLNPSMVSLPSATEIVGRIAVIDRLKRVSHAVATARYSNPNEKDPLARALAAHHWLMTPEGKLELQQISEEIAPKLVPITEEMLLGD